MNITAERDQIANALVTVIAERDALRAEVDALRAEVDALRHSLIVVTGQRDLARADAATAREFIARGN